MAKIIRLKTADGEVFDIVEEIAKCSGTIKVMLEGCTEDEDSEVPLPNINAAILKKILEYATFHKDEAELPLDDDEVKESSISSWDTEFLKVDQGTLFELILAANYLDIKRLLDVTCQAVANMIKGKKPDEIRKHFNIKNDFTKAEQEQISWENKWCEEK